MVRLTLKRPRAAGTALAAAAIVLGACSHSTSPNPSVSASPSPGTSPCTVAAGVAYEPDGGNGAFGGIQYTHFEEFNGNLCAAVSPAATPRAVAFGAHVGGFALSSDATVGLALLFSGTTSGYSLVQSVLGVSSASLVPAGTAYNLAVLPTPAPSVSPLPTPTPVPNPLPLLNDASSLAIVGPGSTALGVTLGPGYPGLIAVTSLPFPPLTFGLYAPYSGTLGSLPTTLRISADGAVALARSTTDLLIYQVTVQPLSYQFAQEKDLTTLGSGTSVVLRGAGAIALDPADSSRAVVAGATGNPNQLTLLTGLPTNAAPASPITVPSTPHSVVITPNGQYAIVGTDAGLYVVNGVNTGTLVPVAPFAPGTVSGISSPAFVGCDAAPHTLLNVASVRFSIDAKYLIALGTGSGVTCASGNNSSILAIPFNESTGSTPSPSPTVAPATSPSPSPNPTLFTQNNVITPPTNADYLVVH